MWDNLLLGLSVNFQISWFDLFGFAIPVPTYILLCLAGCLIGTLIGVLPGLGPVATVSILLPLTFGLDVVGALIMLSGIYYGAQYGGSTAAILVRIPGEVTSVVTVIDGHEMARQGRAGAALGIAAIGSFVAGTFGTLVIVLFSAPLSQMALTFGPAEYCSLILMGLLLAVVLAQGSIPKAVVMIVLGVLLSCVGRDQETGAERLTFGFQILADGIDFSVLALGLFGIAEVMRNLDGAEGGDKVIARPGSPYPTWQEIKESAGAIVRGSALGGLLGVLPGSGGALGPFASYAVEKRIAKDPGRFGHGAIQGVAGPEAANNAGAQTSFIPMLTLGVPPTALMALLVGAMTVQGVVPGPQVMTRNPELFWGLIVSMWVGNAMLLIINLPLIGLWVKFLSVPYRLLFPGVLVVSAVGLFSIGNSEFSVILAALFAVVGYLLAKFGFEPAPILLGFVLGGLFEDNFRRALVLSSGDLLTFVERPLSLALIVISFAALLLGLISSSRRKVIFSDDQQKDEMWRM